MSTCECGHPYSDHGPQARICYWTSCPCLDYTPATERTTTMIDKTPPYVIDFDDIRRGMTIERQWEVGGEVHHRAEAVADHLSEDGTAWLTSGGYFVASDESAAVLRVLAEPVPPMEGYIEAWGTPEFGADEMHLVIATLDRDGDWCGLTKDGESGYLSPGRITRWNPIKIVPADAPTAPKADDGLRERVEALADGFESLPDATSTGRYVAHHLRAALTETGADA